MLIYVQTRTIVLGKNLNLEGTKLKRLKLKNTQKLTDINLIIIYLEEDSTCLTRLSDSLGRISETGAFKASFGAERFSSLQR